MISFLALIINLASKVFGAILIILRLIFKVLITIIMSFILLIRGDKKCQKEKK
jgi:hypothetical protein